jgi:hypothetical protein
MKYKQKVTKIQKFKLSADETRLSNRGKKAAYILLKSESSHHIPGATQGTHNRTEHASDRADRNNSSLHRENECGAKSEFLTGSF